MPILAACCALIVGFRSEQDLSFKTSDGLELHGTFVEPGHAQGSKVKAVVLLPGSGPTDRNGNQPPMLLTDLLKEIAESLAASGIASLRFDKRAAHVNAALWPKDPAKFDDFFAFERFVDDAGSAVEALRKQPGIDGAHVGVIGHSEGGLITLALASKWGREKLSAIGLLGTAGRPLDAVLHDQIRQALGVQTTEPTVIKTYMDALDAAIKHVKDTGTVPTGLPPGLQGLFGPGTGKILRSYFTLDPVKLVQGYKGNVLLLQGELDSQISATKDFPLLKQAIESRGFGSSAAFLAPGASHNLKLVGKPGEAGFAGPVVPAALEKIGSWAAEKL